MVQQPSEAQAPDPSRRTNPYLAVLRIPGGARFSAAALLARMPMSMLGIGTVLMVERVYGSYALAGRVSAVLVLAQAVCSPPLARLVDRAGQRRVMLPLIFLAAVGLAGLVLVGNAHGPEALLYLFAAVSGGSSGSFGSMVRARWSHVISDPRTLHTAYSLESALDEVVFVVGPALVTILATGVAPSAGLLVALVAAFVGGLWFVSQRATEPPTSETAPDDGGRRRRGRSAMRTPGMLVLVLVFVAMGMMFGSIDVSTVAFADEHGRPGVSGLLLGVFACGSLISGLVYGARHWVSPLWRRFVVGVVALAVGAALFTVATSLPVLAAVMFVTGFAIAPTLINGNALVQNLVRPDQLTEGLAWVGTSLGIGVSVGSSIAGGRIESDGAAGGFHVLMAAAGIAVVVTLVSVRRIRRGGPTESVTTS
ncbi:MFS transporter [Cellulomonas sp. PhB143]|uniref:MFS transporter n=1 Tax=Cellulomonas sp. PhB143 TaxID=2485186 RepID=UPI000F49DB11|nr:MFS transporter [Cellulomonas sp. PhB143]ROS79183.1 putative MFS family arabinose efflux permease [Cellulomonas sp. PhB143]